MTGAVSPSTGRPYPRTWICQVWRVARATVYAATAHPEPSHPAGKRGPKTAVRIEALMSELRCVVSPWRPLAGCTGLRRPAFRSPVVPGAAPLPS